MSHLVLAALVGVALIAVGAGVVRGRDRRAGIALVAAGVIDVGLSIARSVVFFGVGVHQALVFARDDIAFVDAARASSDTLDVFGHTAVGAELIVWTLVVFAILRLARPADRSTRGGGGSMIDEALDGSAERIARATMSRLGTMVVLAGLASWSGGCEPSCRSGLLCDAELARLSPDERRALCEWGVSTIEAGWRESFASSCGGRETWPTARSAEQCVSAPAPPGRTVADEEDRVLSLAADPCGRLR